MTVSPVPVTSDPNFYIVSLGHQATHFKFIPVFSLFYLWYNIYLGLLFLASLKKKKVMGIHRIYYTNYFSGSLRPPSRLLTVALYFLCIRLLSALLGSLQAFLNVSETQVYNSYWKLITGHIWPIFKFKSFYLSSIPYGLPMAIVVNLT